MAHLSVIVDGKALDERAARDVWARFSAYMDAHRGDLAGFAAQEGYASARPTMGPEGAILEISSTAPQTPYTSVAAGERGGRRPAGAPRSAASAPDRSERRTSGAAPGARGARSGQESDAVAARPRTSRRRGRRGPPGGGGSKGGAQG